MTMIYTSAPVLTEADLIRSAQKAIAEERLGIQRGATDTLFVYQDGSVCAVGAALPFQVLQTILKNGDERLNWLELSRAEYFAVADLRTVEALTTFQLGYDFCFTEERVSSELVQRFCDYVASLDPENPPALWPSELDVYGLFHEPQANP